MATSADIGIETNALVQKGAALLVDGGGGEGNVASHAALAAFDDALASNEALRPYLWQRGLAAFYAGKFAIGVEQFSSNMSVNGSDVEEVVWHMLCRAKLDGIDVARASMLQMNGKDDRIWSKHVLQLFKCGIKTIPLSSEKLLALGSYMSFYIGLYYEELLDDRSSAEPYLKEAHDNPTDDYMGKLMVMHYRRFCNASVPVFSFKGDCSYTCPRVIVGGWQLSAGHHEGFDETSALENMNNHVKAGFNTFDMGDIYTGVEEIVGKYVHTYDHHQGVQLHSKFVPDLDILGNDTKLNQEYVRRVVQRSCNRLQVDALDLCQFHWWDTSIPRYIEVAQYLNQLRKEHLIRQIGLTNFDASATAEIIAAGVPIVSTQIQYSVLDQRPKKHLEALCLKHGIHMLCYGVLAGCFLTDRWLGVEEVPTDKLENRSLVKYRLIIDEFGGWTKYQELLQAMKKVGDCHQASIAEVAIAFVLSRPGVGSCILGATSSKHVQSSIKACHLKLTESDLAIIDAVAATASGPRGPVYALERDRHGRHGRIMRYNLQEVGTEAHVVELIRRIRHFRLHIESKKSLESHETMRQRLLQELTEVERDYTGTNTVIIPALAQQLGQLKIAMEKKLW